MLLISHKLVKIFLRQQALTLESIGWTGVISLSRMCKNNSLSEKVDNYFCYKKSLI